MSYTNSDFYANLAMGRYSGKSAWTKIGYSPTVNTTESAIWSKAGVYAFMAAAAQLQISSDYVTADSSRDIGTVIHGNAEGANQAIVADASTTTTLVDSDVDFSGGTAVAVGDCILLDPKGTTPEWGYISDITNAATGTLGVSGGFSSGGAPSARAYTIVDASAYTGAQVVKIEYLTSAYAQKSILMCLNAGTAVTTKNSAGANLEDLYRINSFRIIAAGSTYKPKGNLWLESVGTVRTGTAYSYITAGFTRARNSAYSVAAGKTLYITQLELGWGAPNDTKVQSARIILRANREPSTGFSTGSIFYPVGEVQISNGILEVHQVIPIKIPALTDMMLYGIAATGGSGPATAVMRGWLE